MSITICKIQEDGSYHAVINGIGHFFPLNDQEALDRYGVQDWIDAGNTPTPYTPPVETWLDKRLKPIADGGYGTFAEQLEMFGEQGEVAFMAHIQTVKTNHPKPV
jgi:hypothetical protein